MFGQGFEPGQRDTFNDNFGGFTNGEAAAAPFGTVAVAVAPIIQLPPPEQREAWLAALVARDGATSVVTALLRSVPADSVMAITEQLCAQQFGKEPRFCDVSGEHDWEDAGTGPQSPASGMLQPFKRARRSSKSAFHYKRCWKCEPFMGKEEKICVAVRTLNGLETEFAEQCQKTKDEEELGDPHGNARRAARYFMYRLYVYTTFGYLGKGKRIRIPECAVELIRHRLREPGCDPATCALGGPLFRCSKYTGHRAAPDRHHDEEE